MRSGSAQEAGIGGPLSFQLYTRRGGAGALHVLSGKVYAANFDGEVIGAMLATHAAG
jgi:hypothetical protein